MECHNMTEILQRIFVVFKQRNWNLCLQYFPNVKELNWHNLGVRPPCLPLVAAGHWVVVWTTVAHGVLLHWEEEHTGSEKKRHGELSDRRCRICTAHLWSRERAREREREHVSSYIAGKPWTKTVRVSTSDATVLMMPRLAAKMKSGTTTTTAAAAIIIIYCSLKCRTDAKTDFINIKQINNTRCHTFYSSEYFQSNFFFCTDRYLYNENAFWT